MKLFASPERAEGYFIDFDRSVARYIFAQPFANRRRVLDVACGSGYGSFLLSQTAAHVTGVDVDKDTVQFAQKEFASNNVTYRCADACNTGMGSDSIECIVSFETVEHISTYRAFLAEMKRVLKPGGQMIISTPNRFICSPQLQKPLHEHHVIEWSLDEFKALLEEFFLVEEVHVQKFRWSSRTVFLRNLYARFFAMFGQCMLRAALKVLRYAMFSLFASYKKTTKHIDKKTIQTLDHETYKRSLLYPQPHVQDDTQFSIQLFVVQKRT